MPVTLITSSQMVSSVLTGCQKNGKELYSKIAPYYPALKVLYMSGYTENAIIHHGRLDEGVELLQKPFRKTDLARKVREALDRTKP